MNHSVLALLLLWPRLSIDATSWADLLKPSTEPHPGSDPQASGTATTMVYSLIEIMGEDEAFAYMAKLNANIQTYTSSGTGPSKGVNVGDAAIGIQFSPAFFQMKANGQPIEIVFPKEGFGFEFPAASILKGAKNYESAKIFMDWLVSKKGQDVLKSTGTYFYPVIDDAEIDQSCPHSPPQWWESIWRIAAPARPKWSNAGSVKYSLPKSKTFHVLRWFLHRRTLI